MRNSKVSALCVIAAAALTACGGGGGSSGESHAPYNITLRASKSTLPLNISNIGPGLGTYSPYSTSVYVSATENGRPIPGGENVFACNIANGLDYGALYYTDANPEHVEEVDDGSGGKIKVPKAFRSITLGANSGGDTFIFHAGETAGTARITCSVTDPRDKKNYAASIDIVVEAATGKPSAIRTIAANPVLGTQGNVSNISTSVAINAQIFDDANQSVPDTGKPNLQVAIIPGGASPGAKLLTANKDGNSVQVTTRSGVALFSLASGRQEGNILLEMTADRFDNDVSNGIQDAVKQFLFVPVIREYAGPLPDPLQFVDYTPPEAVNGLPYSYAFQAEGGVGPYTWTALGELPTGLTLSPNGLLSGTPRVGNPGVVQLAVQVTDARGQSLISNVALAVKATPEGDPELSSQVLAIVPATPPTLFNNQPYSYALVARGGKAPYRWDAVGALPTGLVLSSEGVISGTPTVLRPGSFPITVRVVDSDNTSVTSNITLTVANTPSGDTEISPLILLDITPPAATNGLPYSYSLRASGGTAPYTWTALGGQESLPAGMTLSASGLLSGTPRVTNPGSFAVGVEVRDRNGQELTGNFILQVRGTPAVDPQLP